MEMAQKPQQNSPGEPVGDLQTALSHAEQLLRHDPASAAAQAEEILKVFPDSDAAQRVLASACRLRRDAQRSLRLLKPLAWRYNDSPSFLHEYGQTLAAVGRGEEAVRKLRRAVELEPGFTAAWRLSLIHI